jgi:hypothetical protein
MRSNPNLLSNDSLTLSFFSTRAVKPPHPPAALLMASSNCLPRFWPVVRVGVAAFVDDDDEMGRAAMPLLPYLERFLAIGYANQPTQRKQQQKQQQRLEEA